MRDRPASYSGHRGTLCHPALHRDVPLQRWPGRGPYTPGTQSIRTPAKVKLRVLLDLSAKASCSPCPGPYPLPSSPFSGLLHLSPGLSNFSVWDRTDQQVHTCQGDSKSCCKSPPSSQKLGSRGKTTWESPGSGPGEGLSVLAKPIAAKPVSTGPQPASSPAVTIRWSVRSERLATTALAHPSVLPPLTQPTNGRAWTPEAAPGAGPCSKSGSVLPPRRAPGWPIQSRYQELSHIPYKNKA